MSKDNKVTICLAMIVRNESSVILRLLESIIGVVDYISICDTGSVDNTPDLINNFGIKNNIPTKVHTYKYIPTDPNDPNDCIPDYINNESYKLPKYFYIKEREGRINQLWYIKKMLYEAERNTFIKEAPEYITKELGLKGKLETQWFTDFAYNRTNSVIKAQETYPKSTYILLMDADMILTKSKNFDKQCLKEDSYLLNQGSSSLVYPNLRLIKTSINWEYKCRTHEYVSAVGKNAGKSLLKTLEIDDRNDGGCKSDKFERDVRLLTLDINDAPNEPRGYFYRANSYRALRIYDEAIKDYLKRTKLGGYGEEIWYSYRMIGKCYECMGNEQSAVYYYLEAYNYDPTRLESLGDLSTFYRIRGKNRLAYDYAKKGLQERPNNIPEGRLFLETIFYKEYNQFHYELSITAYYVGKKAEGFIACKHLQKDPEKNFNVDDNIKFYISTL